MSWAGRLPSISPGFGSTESARLRAIDTWQTDDVALRSWWVGRFNRPPNDPLFAAETHAYWLQFFYTEKMQDRQRLADQINDLSAPHESSPDEAQMRRAQRKSAITAYNLLNTILQLPQENPEAELEADIKASRQGRAPAFLKERRRG